MASSCTRALASMTALAVALLAKRYLSAALRPPSQASEEGLLQLDNLLHLLHSKVVVPTCTRSPLSQLLTVVSTVDALILVLSNSISLTHVRRHNNKVDHCPLT